MAKDKAGAASSAEAVVVDDVIFKEEQHQLVEGGGSGGGGGDDDDDYNSCSICLEPFSSHNPPSVTKCKHDYHLQCILEWCQRSKECPICWQLLVLSDPSSQELLSVVENERNARQIRVVHEVHHVSPYMNDSESEEPILWRLTSTTRARRRRRQTISEIDPSEVRTSAPVTADAPTWWQVSSSRVDDTISAVNAPTSGTYSSTSPGGSSTPTATPRVVLEQSQSTNSQRSGSLELLAFKESIKSKFFAASARCKESISRGTHGFKEKILSRNDTVKELSREVQREMSAGIAGVARMIDRLDLSSMRTGAPLSTSNPADGGEAVQDNTTRQYPSRRTVAPGLDSGADVIVPTRPSIALTQSRE